MIKDEKLELNCKIVLRKLIKDLIFEELILMAFLISVCLSLGNGVIWYLVLLWCAVTLVLVFPKFTLQFYEVKKMKILTKKGTIAGGLWSGKGFTSYKRYHFHRGVIRYYDVINQCYRYRGEKVKIRVTKLSRLIIDIESLS